jgi:hypothetical protein
MRASRVVVAVVFALVGIVWIGQGLGLIGGSAMSGSSFWAGAGAVLVVAGGGLALLERRHATRS